MTIYLLDDLGGLELAISIVGPAISGLGAGGASIARRAGSLALSELSLEWEIWRGSGS